MNRTDLETMKVAELKQLCRERKMPLESKGHKFNKTELIDRLMWYEDDKADIDKKLEESARPDNIDEAVKNFEELANKTKTEEEKWDAPVLQEHKEIEKPKEKKVVQHEENRLYPIPFTKTLDEIIDKYSKPKHESVFENALKVGSFVVFIHYVEAKDGNVYRKLRTAKVTAVNRKKRLVRAESFFGNTFELPFEELLFIREVDGFYPMDINKYLKKQRTEYGRKAVIEKYESEHEGNK